MLGRLLNGATGAAGAALFSQAPAFIIQYQQQISGRLEQVRADLAGLLGEAAARGMEPHAFIAQAKAEGGEFTRTLVADAERALGALDRLQTAYDALVAASPIYRPVAVFQHLDAAVAKATVANFAPAVPLTAAGLVYAGLGLLVALCLLALAERAARGGIAAMTRTMKGQRHGKHSGAR